METHMLLRGGEGTPPTRFDRTALRQLLRLPGWRIWRGERLYGRRIPLSNLFNRTPTPVEEGWSVRITQVRDFRAGRLTYDSHNGTDFATPPGTRVVAAAPGVVRRISSEFHRGGLKIFLDHGGGLATTSNHLARALVRVGERVVRGQVIALSGYSGIDGFATFPFGIPHVHWNVWLNGENVDPFAEPGETSLWLDDNDPRPYRGGEPEEIPESDWDEEAIRRYTAACRSISSRREITAAMTLEEQAFALMFHMNYYPTRFSERGSIYRTKHPRTPRFTLPFHPDDYDGIVFPPE
ncbi:MAG: M23 family metallopeptidase [Polyangiaceae bacterium]|nr:M23 family metallopeptidase [Polyangiaceae bacterium]